MGVMPNDKDLALYSDEEIVKNVAGGDKELFSEIINRYEPKLGRYSKKFLFGYDESADALQEVFIKTYINLKSFDTSKKFSSWIYRIAHNEFINIIKKKKIEPISVFDLDTVIPFSINRIDSTDSEDAIKEKIELEALYNHLEQNIKSLPLKYREPLVLYIYEEKSYEEIGEILLMPTSTVGVRISRAKALLKQLSVSTLATKVGHGGEAMVDTTIV